MKAIALLPKESNMGEVMEVIWARGYAPHEVAMSTRFALNPAGEKVVMLVLLVEVWRLPSRTLRIWHATPQTPVPPDDNGTDVAISDLEIMLAEMEERAINMEARAAAAEERLVEVMMQNASTEEHPDEPEPEPPGPTHEEHAGPDTEKFRASLTPEKLSQLIEVGTIYRRCGGRNVGKAIAAKFGCSTSTASDWIAQARTAGEISSSGSTSNSSARSDR